MGSGRGHLRNGLINSIDRMCVCGGGRREWREWGAAAERGRIIEIILTSSSDP